MIVEDLIRRSIKEFITYTPSKTIGEISQEVRIPVGKILKIDSGENLYVEIMQNKELLQMINLYLYPDPTCVILRKKLSSYTGYDPEWILCGNGSDELIDLLIRTFVSPGEEIIILPPTFSMYAFYGQLSGAKIKSILRERNLNINAKKIARKITAKTKIIFIDSPGNPSSVVVSSSDIERLLIKSVIVVVDEAYFEYCNQTILLMVRKYPNLVVLRSFSKWAGLAGLRIGYMIANPKIIQIIQSIKPPYNVNSVSQIMASEVLDNKEKFLKTIEQIIEIRKEFIAQLANFPQLKVYPSEGAYIIFKPKTKTARIYDYLKQNGILIKIINQPMLENYIRINLVNRENMDKFIFLLRRFYAN